MCPILLILQKGRTTVEWIWYDVIETQTIKDCPLQTFLANSVPGLFEVAQPLFAML